MGIFWNKKTQGNKNIYIRTNRSYILLYIGLFIFFILPIIVSKISFLYNLFNNRLFFYFWIFGGLLVIFIAIFGSYVNFLLLFAKMKGKKYEIKILSDGNTKVIIEK